MNENNFEQLTGQITNNPVTQFWVAGDIHLPVNQQALAWCKRGSENYATGRTQEALHCFRQAAQLVSNSGGIYYAQAICLIKMGQVAEARVSLQQEISNPQVHPRARELLKELQNGLNLESSSKDIITFFAIPKSFQNHHIATIQRNAIRSWTLLQPRPEIILFGNEAGTAEIARELGLRHIPDVKRNEFGTPLLSDLFHQAQLHASQTVLTYINADIILTSDFIPAVHQVATQFTQNFLMIGQRWELDIATLLNFAEPTWETQLRECLPQTGRLHEVTAIDYYVFRKNLWPTIPPFAIGRTVWDNWLVYNALTTQQPVIDATQVVTIIHQSHDYAHLRGGKQEAWNGIEAQRNRFLAGGGKHLAFISHATWQLTPTGLTQKPVQQNVPTPVPLNSAPTQERLKNTSWQLQTPVAFIIFNRPDTTERVFEAIRQAKPPKLLVVADGPRQDRPDEAAKCAATRAIINRVDWPCEVLTNYSETNLGCKHRPASGITWVFSQVEEAIILEDDCLPHPSFFRFCEELLERYRYDERIMAISGDNFQFGRKRGEHSYYFSRYNHIWGWASWRRAWQLYDVQMTRWPQAREQNWLASLLKSPPAVKQWSRGFQSCYDGLDAWDYAWTFTCWLHNGLTILPNVNLISNIGFGPAATHTTMSGSSSANMPTEAMNFPLRHPPIIVRDEQADDFTERTVFSGGIPPEPAQTNIDLLVQQAITHLNANQNQEALNLFDQVLRTRPDLVTLHYGKAVALTRLGRVSEAVETLNQLLAKVPTHEKSRQLLTELRATHSAPEIQAMLQQATEFFNQGKKVEALRRAEQAASFGVFVPEMHYLRAIFLSAVGRHEEALEAVKQELDQNPSHAEAKTHLEFLTKAVTKSKPVPIPTEKRPWNTSIPRELMMSIQNATHNYSYRGVPMIKNPFDFALYPLLLWNVKPRTVIEIGSKSGGSALWFGDLFDNFGLDGHIYSIDIVKVTQVSHRRVTFMEGDGKFLQETLSSDFLRSLPHPLLVIEDADHSFEVSKSVLDMFHPYLETGEYIVIEDGIISDIVQDSSCNSGPHRALKAFLAEHQGEYEIDGEYCDYFGYNTTWCTNGFLKKVQKQIETQVPQLKTSQIQDPEFQQLFNLVRPHSMLSEARLYSLFSLVKRICIENLPGNIVECGVAGGGSTALMALVIKRYTKQQRWLYAFDSFNGMPPPTQHDKHQGMSALATGWGTGTCAGSEEHLRNLCVQLGIADLVKPVKGYFQDTLPKMRNWVGMIALLHLDGDWYESTKVILHHLYDRVVHNGFLQVDDYGYWEGCRQAVHEFETSHALQFEINRIDDTGVWFVKPDKFPFNPILAPPLINEFFQDDPVTLGVQSQMSQNERFQLYYALRKLLPTLTTAPLRFIEIGAFAGASLWLTCQALKRVIPHFQGFAIEPGHHPQLLEVLKHVHPYVTHLPMLSPQAVPQLQQQFARDGNFPLFIFVDGDHTYEGVWRDAMDYFQLLAPGGLMVFHDYLPPLTDENRDAILFHHGGKEPGVRQAFEELVECTYGEVVEIPLLSPSDPTQTQAYLPIIPGVVSTIRAYRKAVV